MWRSPGLRKRRRSVRSVEKIGAGEQPAAAGDDVFFDEDDFLSGTIFGSSDNSTTEGSNRTAAGMSESLSLFQSIHVLQADEHLNETNAGQLTSIQLPLHVITSPHKHYRSCFLLCSAARGGVGELRVPE